MIKGLNDLLTAKTVKTASKTIKIAKTVKTASKTAKTGTHVYHSKDCENIENSLLHLKNKAVLLGNKKWKVKENISLADSNSYSFPVAILPTASFLDWHLN